MRYFQEAAPTSCLSKASGLRDLSVQWRLLIQLQRVPIFLQNHVFYDPLMDCVVRLLSGCAAFLIGRLEHVSKATFVQIHLDLGDWS